MVQGGEAWVLDYVIGRREKDDTRGAGDRSRCFVELPQLRYGKLVG